MYHRLKKWLKPSGLPPELRRASRVFEPGVLVYYWDGSTPVPHQLRDISLTGAYLYTSERWYPGTIVRLLLQQQPGPADGDGRATLPASVSVSVPARVVWDGPDGVALEFLLRKPKDREVLVQLIAGVRGQAA